MSLPDRARVRGRLRAKFPHGVASAQQLEAHGVPARTVYHRCGAGGPWQRPLPGIIVLSTGHLTADQVVSAALLLGGPDAMVTGLEACRRYGLRRGPRTFREHAAVPEEVHLLLPHGRQVRDVGFVHVERTTRMPYARVRGGFPLAPVDRACLDAARRLRDPGDVAELLSDAVQRGLCTVAAMHTELESGSKRGTRTPRAVLREIGAGVRSAAEREARQLLTRSRLLPTARWNIAVRDGKGQRLGIADCWFDDVALA